MKVIGLIGGMSWESTAVYYQQINLAVRRRFGGLHSARVVMHSCDFDEIVTLQRQGRWDILGDTLADAARSLEKAGADCLAICTNTMHKVAQEVQAAVNIPLIDIRDATGAAVRADHIRKVGLLGTQYTMEQSFFRDHLTQEWNLEVVTPTERMRGIVHHMIFGELCQGNVLSQNRSELLSVIDELAAHGAEGIILGCTELMLLLNQDHCAQPLYDTTTLHAEALVAYALDEHQSVPLWTPAEFGAFEAVLI